MRSLLNWAVLVFVALATAASTTGNRLLVVMGDVAEKDAYSKFLGDLQDRGFDISYETPKGDSLSLFRLGQRMFDHLLFLPIKLKALGPNLTPNLLLDFVKAEGNVILALSSAVPASTSIVNFLAELDIELPAERTGTVVDHFHYDTIAAPEKHDILVLDAPSNVRPGMEPYFERPGSVLSVPHASGHVLGASQLLTPILRAPATAYSYNPKEQTEVVDPEELFAAGKQLALASAFQARNSARVSVLGAAEMLQDKWLDARVSRVNEKEVVPENREFAKWLSGWTFQEIGVLRVNEIEHWLKGDNETNPHIYRVKNDVSYRISLSEWKWDHWDRFTLPAGDALQLEFSMLSPFHRLDLMPMKVTDNSTTYGTSFRLPDQHGIFNFMVNYKRPFLTYIEEKKTVTVRHIAHDEWPRSYTIWGAYPWMAGIATTVIGFVGFCAVWLYSKPEDAKPASKKE